jgi:hypothetical protein
MIPEFILNQCLQIRYVRSMTTPPDYGQVVRYKR